MSRFASSIPIAATPAEVWEVLVDVEGWPAWASQFKRLERLDAAPLALGSRVRVRPKGMLASNWRVTEYDEGRSFTWESSLAPGLLVTGGHVLSPDGAGTWGGILARGHWRLGRAPGPSIATDGLQAQHPQRS
ncbi:MAG: SRPBCC family protein [Chloroflexota bacterium]